MLQQPTVQVVSAFLQLPKAKVKHGYNLSLSLNVPAPYRVYCTQPECESILRTVREHHRRYTLSYNRTESLLSSFLLFDERAQMHDEGFGYSQGTIAGNDFIMCLF